MIHETYQSEIEKLRAVEKQMKQRSNIYLWGKLLFFAGAALCGYLSFTEAESLSIIGTIGCFAVYVALYIKDAACQKHIQLLRRKQAVCTKELAGLKGDFTSFDAGERNTDYLHEYAYDLDLFGKDSLYNRINRTVTQRGSDRLAKKLTTLPTDKETILAYQAAIAELATLHDWRIRYMAASYVKDNLGSLSKSIHLENIPWLIRSAIPYLLGTSAMVLLLLGASGVIPWDFFGGMFVLNLCVSLTFGKALQKTHANIDKLHKECKGHLEVLKDIHRAAFQSEVLKGLQEELFGKDNNSLDAFRELSRLLNFFDQRGNVIVYVLLNGCMLFDLLLIKRFSRWTMRYLPSMEHWLDCMAEVDALVSLGTYAFNHPANTHAELLEDDSEFVLQATDIYHPFLAHKKAVPNDFTLKKSNIAIVTGANMAGKSTFLRTIGINYVLAANGAPVCARSFRCAVVTLFSSMRTTDNLSQDISYFNAELIRLEQLIKHVRSHRFTLIILDEILKGTNSRDKLEGSKIFLQALSPYPIAALIATHDLELAHLETEDSDTYKNYRFEIALSEDITYSYKIERGIAQNLNASYLLKNMLHSLCHSERSEESEYIH